MEAEAREEEESDRETEEDRPLTSRTSTSAAFGDVETSTPEKVASRRQAVAEEECGVVGRNPGRPKVARKPEEGRNVVVAATTTDGKRSDVGLPVDASGVGVCGKGFVMGTTRPRARGGREEAAPSVCGQTGEADKWSSESAVMAEMVGRRVPEVIRQNNRWVLHFGDVFGYIVKLVQRKHKMVDRAAE